MGEIQKAILFLNLGGPEKISDVKNFLYRLFSDPEIIRIKWTPLRKLVAWIISTLREKKSQELYKQIGGGSPILALTNSQAQLTESKLKENGFPVFVRTAFSCSPPLIDNVVRDLYKSGVRSFLSFPLYPQYSYTTTKSALDQVRGALKKIGNNTQLHEIKSWPAHPLFIKAHQELILSEVQKFENPDPREIFLLFSAHSIPAKLVEQEGDPYKKEVEMSVKGILSGLEWTGKSGLGWQSKLGPVKWLAPATVDVIKDLGSRGVKNILVVPIAFVTDHIETLEEIDRQMAEVARESGISEFRRTPGLNSHPAFIEALVDLAQSESRFWGQN